MAGRIRASRLPEHPLSGLLWRALRQNHLEWLSEAIPEDFQQEVHLFLLEWQKNGGAKGPLGPEEVKNFFRLAGRHFYQVAVNYGFKKPRGGKWETSAERLDPLEDAEEDSYEKRVAIQNWRSRAPEDSLEFQERLEFCKGILGGKTDWYAFKAYLSGCNLDEIAFLTGWGTSSVKKRLVEIIRQIREAAGVDPNLPLPPMPKNGKVEFRQSWKEEDEDE